MGTKTAQLDAYQATPDFDVESWLRGQGFELTRPIRVTGDRTTVYYEQDGHPEFDSVERPGRPGLPAVIAKAVPAEGDAEETIPFSLLQRIASLDLRHRRMLLGVINAASNFQARGYRVTQITLSTREPEPEPNGFVNEAHFSGTPTSLDRPRLDFDDAFASVFGCLGVPQLGELVPGEVAELGISEPEVSPEESRRQVALELAVDACGSGGGHKEQVLELAKAFEAYLLADPQEDRVLTAFRSWFERVEGDARVFLHGLFDLAVELQGGGETILGAQILTRNGFVSLGAQGEIIPSRELGRRIAELASRRNDFRKVA